MPPAARVGDVTTHGGTIVGPGVATVIVGGMPAAVVGDSHVCVIPPATPHGPTVSPFPTGSATVFIDSRPALRTTDVCACGAGALMGALTVLIG